MTKTEQFAVRGLKLPTNEAIAKIQADTGIKDADKAYLVEKIQKSGFAGVIVDAHEHFHDGATHIHISITRLY